MARVKYIEENGITLKTCNKCGKSLDRGKHFYKRILPSGKVSYRSFCKPCEKYDYQKRRPLKKEQTRQNIFGIIVKKCTKCGEKKDESKHQFAPVKKKGITLRHRSICVECCSKIRKESASRIL